MKTDTMAKAYPTYLKALNLFNNYPDKGETERAFRRRETTFLTAWDKVCAATIRTMADVLAGYVLLTEHDAVDPRILRGIRAARAKLELPTRKRARG